jgi:hypothetical protein
MRAKEFAAILGVRARYHETGAKTLPGLWYRQRPEPDFRRRKVVPSLYAGRVNARAGTVECPELRDDGNSANPDPDGQGQSRMTIKELQTDVTAMRRQGGRLVTDTDQQERADKLLVRYTHAKAVR